METIDIEKIVIDNHSKNNKYSHEEKVKYLQDAIQNGGYYGDGNVWNSIAIFNNDNHIYRIRVETLIIKDGKYIFLKFLNPHTDINKRRYLIPGGSITKGVTNIEQAINECKEEAKIVVKNIKSSGVHYKEYTKPPSWAIAMQPVNWNGNYTEIYVAEYEKLYNGPIKRVDMDRFMASGKFYELDKVYPHLRKEHKDALYRVYPYKFKCISKDKNIMVWNSKYKNPHQNKKL